MFVGLDHLVRTLPQVCVRFQSLLSPVFIPNPECENNNGEIDKGCVEHVYDDSHKEGLNFYMLNETSTMSRRAARTRRGPRRKNKFIPAVVLDNHGNNTMEVMVQVKNNVYVPINEYNKKKSGGRRATRRRRGTLRH